MKAVLKTTHPIIHLTVSLKRKIMPVTRYTRLFAIAVFALLISACASTKTKTPGLPPEIITAPPAEPAPDTPEPEPEPTPMPAPRPEPMPAPTPAPAPKTPTEDTTEKSAFAKLPYWKNANPAPALKAFKKSCLVWEKRNDTRPLHKIPDFGHYGDWRTVCEIGKTVNLANAKWFFETYFTPIELSDNNNKSHLTAYYAPEIPVRRKASLEFSEPILARPKSKKIQNLPRKFITAKSAKVLAYGKPADVFFLQVQGSGTIRFADGSVYVAAFDGHNNQPYTSIGKLLLKRGELKKGQAGKADIEEWMAKAGYKKTKALINENARYVFFKTEYLGEDAGPKGAKGVRLTPMGSIAVDPKYTPYGVPIWVVNNFPQYARDYKGRKQGHLLIAQDTGGAIKGKMRGDVFFGIGKEAGEKAGVMNHRGKWFILVPKHLAEQEGIG